MNTPLGLHWKNPCRPPDWRWLRAAGIVHGAQQRPTRRRDGEANFKLIREAANFCRDYSETVQNADTLRQIGLVDQYPALVWAHQIYSDGDNIQRRYLIEARLLAKQTNREIAYCLGADEDVVEMYESLFFSVRDRLNYPDYIFQTVLGGDLHGRLDSLSYGLLWKLFAYLGGPYVLEALVRRVANPTWVTRMEEVLPFFHDIAIGTMKQRAAIAATTIPVNTSTNIPILEAFVRYVEVERTTDGTGQAENQMMTNIAGMLAGLPLSIGTREGAIEQFGQPTFDTSGVELRGDELMRVHLGQEMSDQTKLLDIKFPEITNGG